jgi:hypothetical protein
MFHLGNVLSPKQPILGAFYFQPNLLHIPSNTLNPCLSIIGPIHCDFNSSLFLPCHHQILSLHVQTISLSHLTMYVTDSIFKRFNKFSQAILFLRVTVYIYCICIVYQIYTIFGEINDIISVKIILHTKLILIVYFT